MTSDSSTGTMDSSDFCSVILSERLKLLYSGNRFTILKSILHISRCFNQPGLWETCKTDRLTEGSNNNKTLTFEVLQWGLLWVSVSMRRTIWSINNRFIFRTTDLNFTGCLQDKCNGYPLWTNELTSLSSWSCVWISISGSQIWSHVFPISNGCFPLPLNNIRKCRGELIPWKIIHHWEFLQVRIQRESGFLQKISDGFRHGPARGDFPLGPRRREISV